MSAPAYPPAVLAALARVAQTRAHQRTTEVRSLDRLYAMEDSRQAMFALWRALDDADTLRDAAMHAADSEALDEARRASPHRFSHPYGGPT